MNSKRCIVPKKCVPIYNMGTNRSEFRIPSGTDWTLMDDSTNIVLKNVFLFNRSKDGTVVQYAALVLEILSSIPGSRILVSTSFLSV